MLSVTESSEKRTKSNISQFPIPWLIKICQHLDEKDLYRFEQTCRSVQKAAKDPNALYSIQCNIFEYFDKYARNERYNKIQSIIIKETDHFPGHFDKLIAPKMVNTFPNLRSLKLSLSLCLYGYEYKTFPMFLQEICKLVSMPRMNGKLCFNIHVIHSAQDFINWSLDLFDLTKNSLISKVLYNVESLTFNIGSDVKCLDAILSTIDSLKMKDKTFQTVRCYIDYHSGSLVQEPDNEHFWKQMSRMNKYCKHLQVFVKYNDGYNEHTQYMPSYWDEFIEQLLQRKVFESFKMQIIFKQKRFAEFQKHLNPWFRITAENMRLIGLKDMDITIKYMFVDSDLKMKMLESVQTVCKECIESNRMVEFENLDIDSKPPNHPFIRYTVKL